MSKLKLTNKIQVLLEEEDSLDLYNIIFKICIEKGIKPIPMSQFLREMIKDLIDKEKNRPTLNQISYVEEHVNRIIKETKLKNNVR